MRSLARPHGGGRRRVGPRRTVALATVLTMIGTFAGSAAPGLASVGHVAAQTGVGDFIAPDPAPLPATVDADGDGWIDTVERGLGSAADAAASTPESISIPPSCWNGDDDDGDGLVDDDDPGCAPVPILTGIFPDAGADTFESTMGFDGYELETALGTCPIDFDGIGPVVVDRSAPTGGGGSPRTFMTEIVALQHEGTGVLLPGSPCNPGVAPVAFPVTLIEDPEQASTGTVTSEDQTGTRDYPARSDFLVHFLVNTPIGLLPGGPPGGPVGDPVRVGNTVNSMVPYHTPANADLNPECYEVDRATHSHCPKPPLDHFLCYSGNFAERTVGDVLLSDQFGRLRPVVGAGDRFCNAVGKNAVPIFDEGAHLQRFAFVSGGDAAVARNVEVWNQLGSQQPLEVGLAAGLFVPSQKGFQDPPKALDHFTCYEVEGAAIGRAVSLADQFTPAGAVRRATVATPRFLCNPTTKTFEGIVTPVADPNWHLVCYTLEGAEPIVRSIRIRNQFVDETAGLGLAVELCVPSMKRIVPDEEPPPTAAPPTVPPITDPPETDPPRSDPPDDGTVARHPRLRGTGRYRLARGEGVPSFEVPFEMRSSEPCTYDRLIFRGNQPNRLIYDGPGHAVYLDQNRLFDELTWIFHEPDSGRTFGLIASGPEVMLPRQRNRIVARVMEAAPIIERELGAIANGRVPASIVRALGLRGDVAIYTADYAFRNGQRANRALAQAFAEG